MPRQRGLPTQAPRSSGGQAPRTPFFGQREAGIDERRGLQSAAREASTLTAVSPSFGGNRGAVNFNTKIRGLNTAANQTVQAFQIRRQVFNDALRAQDANDERVAEFARLALSRDRAASNQDIASRRLALLERNLSGQQDDRERQAGLRDKQFDVRFGEEGIEQRGLKLREDESAERKTDREADNARADAKFERQKKIEDRGLLNQFTKESVKSFKESGDEEELVRLPSKKQTEAKLSEAPGVFIGALRKSGSNVDEVLFDPQTGDFSNIGNDFLDTLDVVGRQEAFKDSTPLEIAQTALDMVSPQQPQAAPEKPARRRSVTNRNSRSRAAGEAAGRGGRESRSKAVRKKDRLRVTKRVPDATAEEIDTILDLMAQGRTLDAIVSKAGIR